MGKWAVYSRTAVMVDDFSVAKWDARVDGGGAKPSLPCGDGLSVRSQAAAGGGWIVFLKDA